jgi:putative FmdB family regulatory protein
MPIYEYRCANCGHELEALQKLSDAPLRACPACGKETLTKLVSAAGFQLKGSGWYATDFKGSGSKPAAKSGAAEGGDKPAGGDKQAGGDATAAKSEPKSDAKSETKADAPAKTPSAGPATGTA